MKATAYLRVSTEDQSNGIEAQRAAIVLWAARRGAEVVSWHEDFGVSGGAALDKRPGLLAALSEVGDGMVLVVAKRDRLARDVVTAATVERLVARVGATVESAAGEGDGDGPDAMLMRTIIDAFAQYERALIASRTKAALAVKKARGERTGSVPLGKVEGEGGKLLPCDREQEAIALARRLRGCGMSLREIAAELDERGFASRSGNGWFPQQISRMLAQ